MLDEKKEFGEYCSIAEAIDNGRSVRITLPTLCNYSCLHRVLVILARGYLFEKSLDVAEVYKKLEEWFEKAYISKDSLLEKYKARVEKDFVKETSLLDDELQLLSVYDPQKMNETESGVKLSFPKEEYELNYSAVVAEAIKRDENHKKGKRPSGEMKIDIERLKTKETLFEEAVLFVRKAMKDTDKRQLPEKLKEWIEGLYGDENKGETIAGKLAARKRAKEKEKNDKLLSIKAAEVKSEEWKEKLEKKNFAPYKNTFTYYSVIAEAMDKGALCENRAIAFSKEQCEFLYTTLLGCKGVGEASAFTVAAKLMYLIAWCVINTENETEYALVDGSSDFVNWTGIGKFDEFIAGTDRFTFVDEEGNCQFLIKRASAGGEKGATKLCPSPKVRGRLVKNDFKEEDYFVFLDKGSSKVDEVSAELKKFVKEEEKC